MQEKFRKWYELRREGVNFNERLMRNREFHNPNIGVKMLEFIGVNEWGTNFPPEVYDPSDFPLEADYEAIGKDGPPLKSSLLSCVAQAQRAKWEEEARQTAAAQGPNARIAAPYIQVPGGSMAGRDQQTSYASRKHQLMMERFYGHR